MRMYASEGFILHFCKNINNNFTLAIRGYNANYEKSEKFIKLVSL